MSSYACFYIHHKDSYINLDSFSRNSAVYEYCHNYLPYGKGIVVTEDLLARINDDIEAEDKKYAATVRKYNERKQLVVQMSNSIEDKMEAIHDIDATLEEVNDIHEQLVFAKGFFNTLYGFATSMENAELMAGIEWDPTYYQEVEE